MFKRSTPNQSQNNQIPTANKTAGGKPTGIGRGMMQKSHTMFVNQSSTNQSSVNSLNNMQNKENTNNDLQDQSQPVSFAEQNRRKSLTFFCFISCFKHPEPGSALILVAVLRPNIVLKICELVEIKIERLKTNLNLISFDARVLTSFQISNNCYLHFQFTDFLLNFITYTERAM